MVFIETLRSTLVDFLRVSASITTVEEVTEIIILAALLYYFMRWLNRDTNKQLLAAFVGYQLLLIISYFLGMGTLSWILLLSLPVILTLLVIAHQDSLQKNCIAYKVIRPTRSGEHFKWLDTLMQACMSSAHKEQEITCIIERFDVLESLLETAYTLNADMCTDLLELHVHYIQSTGPTATTNKARPLVWIHHGGAIKSVSAYFKDLPEAIWFDKACHQLPVWKKNALAITTKTDALVVHLSPKTRLFECVVAGTSIEQLTPTATLLLIKEYLIKQTINNKTKIAAHYRQVYQSKSENDNHEKQV